jgi:hypothetical protein
MEVAADVAAQAELRKLNVLITDRYLGFIYPSLARNRVLA